ncbi:hypothetical protein SCAR479_01241 [Seiridium cardinale]|uniref:ORP1 like protein n=1 Tax=Seiridium cardinale TaxID=138064 RepID=A0ABR2Y853_9PEZI
MDVTSMLNSASAAARREARESTGPTTTPSVVDGTTVCSSAVQTPSPERTPSRRTSESRTPNRARTPWDAGGYSLPLTLDTKVATQPPTRPAFYNESPIDSASPKSPKHRFSDSYSSLSSYTSSLNSMSHSRFSSLSTVSGFQSLGPLLTDMPALESRSCDNLDSAVSRSSIPDYFGKRVRKDGGTSPTTIAEEPAMGDVRRPGSPSDAMLISRGMLGSDRMSPQDITDPESKSVSSFLALPDLSRSHKRAVSAPDFAAINAIDQSYSTTPQTLQPTPPPSQQGDRRTSYIMEAVSVSPTASDSTEDKAVACMYVDNCETGSQPRKAISHIFGRNKLCTRMIPQHVWVHFCRKHYQRSRYRNAQEYSKLQCELVQKQIQRVQEWSDGNKKSGRSGVVQDWSLSVRKREQKRLDDKASSTRKRRYRDESDGEEGADNAVLNGTAVPNWLLAKCNSGYSTAQIEEIVEQLKNEMDDGKLAQIPDIEILPNISTDTSSDGKSKVVMKRKTSAGSGIHKRSQSVGFTQAIGHDTTPMMRRISQPGFNDWRADNASNASPIEKRQRTSTLSPYGTADRLNHRGSLSQVPERGIPAMGYTQHATLPHRPASYSYTHIRESPVEEAYYDNVGTRSSHYSYGGPLPAPAPQRLGQHMAAQLETNTPPQGYFDVRRPSHQRAQSEMGTFHHNPSFTFRASSSMEYPGVPQSYSTEPMPYEAYQTPAYGNPGGPPGYYDESSMNRPYATPQMWQAPADPHSSPWATPRHTRHQSTSAVPQNIPRIPPSDNMYGSLHGSPGHFDGQSSHHRRQYSYTPSQTGPYEAKRVHETDQAKALFRERR